MKFPSLQRKAIHQVRYGCSMHLLQWYNILTQYFMSKMFSFMNSVIGYREGSELDTMKHGPP